MYERRTDPPAITRRTFVAAAATSVAAVPAIVGERAEAASPQAGELDLTLNVNGTDRTLAVEPRVTLLDALRDHLGLTGTKKGCDQGTCGACTVLVNGRRIDACLTLAVMHRRDRIQTIEGLAENGELHPLQQAFIARDAFQCGYCTSGQILSAIGLLNEGRPATREAVQTGMSGNLCRCGCYPHIVDAVLDVKAQP